jgi:hypothetical protein
MARSCTEACICFVTSGQAVFFEVGLCRSMNHRIVRPGPPAPPGPRKNGRCKSQKNETNWRFFRRFKSATFAFGARFSRPKALRRQPFGQMTFLSPGSKTNGGAPFSVILMSLERKRPSTPDHLRVNRTVNRNGPSRMQAGAGCAPKERIELPANSGGLLVRCRSMAPRA